MKLCSFNPNTPNKKLFVTNFESNIINNKDIIDINLDETVKYLVLKYIDHYFSMMTADNWTNFIVYIRDIIVKWDPKDFLIKNRLPVKLIEPTNSTLENMNRLKLDTKDINDIFIECQDITPSCVKYQKYKHEGVLDMPIKYNHTHIVLPKCLNAPSIKEFIYHTVASELALRSILENNLFFEENKTNYCQNTIAKIHEINKQIKEDLTEFNICNLEHIIKNNPRLYTDYNLYLTVHVSMVERGKTQRNSGIHVDGFQGSTYPIKFQNDHSYIYVNQGPTLFTDEPYQPPDNYCTNWYEGEHGMSNLRYSLKPGIAQNLIMMSGLQLHEAGTVPKDSNNLTNNKQNKTGRFFYRAEFTLKDYNRKGNTINKKLGQFEEYIDRSIKKTLNLNDIRKFNGVDFGS